MVLREGTLRDQNSVKWFTGLTTNPFLRIQMINILFLLYSLQLIISGYLKRIIRTISNLITFKVL